MAADQSSGPAGQTVGARLRAARRAKKYTQGRLAAPDFSVSYISAIERGQIQPSLRALEILARRLELSTTNLLPGHIEQKPAAKILMDPTNHEEAIIELLLIEAHIEILQGRAAQAITTLKQLGDRNMPVRQRLSQQYLLGWAYLLTLQFQKCEHILALAQQLAQDQHDSYFSLRIANLLGQTYTAMHNPQRALQAHQECLRLLEQLQLQDPFFKCRVYNQLGLQQLDLNDISSAAAMFQEAVTLADELSTPARVHEMYRKLCTYYSEAEENTLASLFSYKSLLLDSSHVGGMPRSEVYLYLGRAMMKNDPLTARAYLEEALQQTVNLQDDLTLASITIRLAEWYLTADDLPDAAIKAAEAHRLAQPFGDTLIAVETLIIWGRIQYALAQYEAGDEHFVAGLEMLERLQIVDELAEQLAQYAQLLAERDKAQEALTYYKRAFESRRSAAYL
jgi:transcriptional regulator with XRE-family HTH domain